MELLEYEEGDISSDCGGGGSSQDKLKFKSGNNKIPSNPFRATVRVVNRTSSKLTPFKDNKLIRQEKSESDWSQYQSFEHDSPNSFPGSPDSRAKVMSISEIEADSVVFIVRDKLRLETQAESSGTLSRHAASRLQERRQANVAFDPTYTLPCTYLACGNHYALKTGADLCSTNRASLPIWVGVYVYVEFSLTAQCSVSPSAIATGTVDVCIGLVPSDCPPNVSVGHWPMSIGLNSNGTLFISGKEYYSLADNECIKSFETIVHPSTTVGMLVFVSSTDPSQDVDKKPIPNTSHLLLPIDESSNSEVSSSRFEEEQKSDSIVYKSNYSAEDSPGISSSISCSQNADEAILNSPKRKAEKISIVYNVSGNVLPMMDSANYEISKLWDLNKVDIYPAISLRTMNSGTWCRFCASDIKNKSRSSIGAPDDARVYCLDGSLLIGD